jgi:tubulin--tyrosine ligase-like protein 12
MFCHDFIRLFEEQNPNQSWNDVEKQIFSMLGELLRAAAKGESPAALMPNPQSRALYGVDLMLSWSDSVSGLFLNKYYTCAPFFALQCVVFHNTSRYD